jgi:vancomycin aglycone glucosyltransferase
MKIGIVINGTRGDVQPMLALALELIKNNHEIVFCAPPENENLVRGYNCPYVAFGPNYKEYFQKNADFKGGQSVGPSPKEGKKEMENQFKLLPAILKDCQLILGVGFVLGVHTVADVLKIPYRFVVFYPVLLGTTKKEPLKNRLMFGLGRKVTNMVLKGFINKKRKELGLNPIKDVWQYWLGEKVIVACDKELNSAKEGVSFKFVQTAYMHLPANNALPEKVENFINSGEPPVFISFGSNPISKPEKYAELFNKVSKSTKQRLIISKGWADLPDTGSPEILYVDEMPYEYLFPKLSAIVFHGGTGTMAAAAKAGIPQIAFPFMADQFDNRKQIDKLGLGPKVCDFKKITEQAISNAIIECLKNEKYKKNAVELSHKLKNVNGVEMTMKLIENEFKIQ